MQKYVYSYVYIKKKRYICELKQCPPSKGVRGLRIYGSLFRLGIRP